MCKPREEKTRDFRRAEGAHMHKRLKRSRERMIYGERKYR